MSSRKHFKVGDRARVVREMSFWEGMEGPVVAIKPNATKPGPIEVDIPGHGRLHFKARELELIEAIDPDVATLRRAAAQARAEGQDADGPSRKAMFNFASMLMNEADKVESGDRSTLPPVLASARAWLDGAVAS